MDVLCTIIAAQRFDLASAVRTATTLTDFVIYNGPSKLRRLSLGKLHTHFLRAREMMNYITARG